MRRFIATNELEKKEWLRYRKMGITGTDAGAICGLNPYVSAFQVYQDKITDNVEETDNEAMRQERIWKIMLHKDLQKKQVLR